MECPVTISSGMRTSRAGSTTFCGINRTQNGKKWREPANLTYFSVCSSWFWFVLYFGGSKKNPNSHRSIALRSVINAQMLSDSWALQRLRLHWRILCSLIHSFCLRHFFLSVASCVCILRDIDYRYWYMIIFINTYARSTFDQLQQRFLWLIDMCANYNSECPWLQCLK